MALDRFPFCARRRIAIVLFVGTALAQAQVNAADLRGFVRDPQGAVVPGATVTARNAATNVERTTTTNDEGYYQITNLPPGEYEVTVEAANFKRAVNPSVTLTVGQRPTSTFALEVGAVTESITVTGATTEVVETSRTNVSNTIDQTRIDNLPINQRDYINFTLTTSTVTRDNGRPIGPAPTSGLNFGGQRGRSNLVQVDGADNTDNSVNAARSTVSQEAVQEFQVVTNSFAPEFGRTSGGVVNVVTKCGHERRARQRLRLHPPQVDSGAQRLRARHRQRPGQEAAVHARAVRRDARRPARPRPHLRLLRLRAAPAAGVRLLHHATWSGPDEQRRPSVAPVPPLRADLQRA